MMASIKKFVCDDEETCHNKKGVLEGQGYEVIFEPQHIKHGTTDMTAHNGGNNHYYDDAWVVIGIKR